MAGSYNRLKASRERKTPLYSDRRGVYYQKGHEGLTRDMVLSILNHGWVILEGYDWIPNSKTCSTRSCRRVVYTQLMGVPVCKKCHDGVVSHRLSGSRLPQVKTKSPDLPRGPHLTEEEKRGLGIPTRITRG